MEYTVFLWEPYICAHLLPWVHGLVKDKRVKAVYYIAPCAVIAYRKEMGWSENDIPKNDGVNYIIAPDDKKLKEIYETDTDTAIHIYHGLAVNKIEGHYFKFGLKYKINRSICYEGPKTLFHPLWQHYLNFYLRKYMYVKYINNVFAIGEQSEKYYRSLSKKWNVYPFMYATETPNNLIIPNKPIFMNVCYVGTLSDLKNVSYLINELYMLPKSSFHLDIYGDGEKRAEIEEQISSLGLSDYVSIKGYQKLNVIYDVLPQYDVLCLPSKLDGWGAVINEAVMRGVYALCSDQCGAASMLKNRLLGSSFKLKQGALAKEFIYVLSNLSFIRSQAQQRVEWCKRITGDVIGKYILDKILLGNNSRNLYDAPND